MSELHGTAVIVTGAARGLGRAMALGFAKAGARIVAVDLAGEAGLAETAAMAGDGALAVGGDLTDPVDCERVAMRAGALDLPTALVNCAGVGQQFINPQFASRPTRFWELSVQQYRDGMTINAFTQFLLARACVPAMLKRGWGRIVNVTTGYGTMLLPGFTPYGPAKAACEAATAIWAKDLAGTGVTCNGLLPGGAANTRMITDDKVFADRAALVQPEAMVAPARWLASRASDDFTGRRIVAKEWDAKLPPREAALKASRAAAWPELN